jgi:HlyD family secretion protein
VNALAADPGPSIRRHAVAGLASLVLLSGGLGGWAATTELSGAIVAAGTLVVDSNVKTVQHPSGGVVGELKVRDGDRVKAGEVIARLDATETRANLSIVLNSLDQLAARQARLEAERDGSEQPVFAEPLASRAEIADIARLIEGEHRLFELRRTARLGQKAQLGERAAQLGEEIKGLSGQAAAKEREIALIERELEGVRELYGKNLIPLPRLTALEREAVRIDGERNQVIASAAQAKGRIAEIALQTIQIDQDLRSEVAKELRDIQDKTAELAERKVAAEDKLRRIDIRAPQDGIVHELSVHTVGGVVKAGETLMLIVPASDDLSVEAQVRSQDIDQLRPGQPVTLRFPAFNQRTTPEIDGVMRTVSADVVQDQKTGTSHYVARIQMPAAEIARLEGLSLVPGMPVDAYIRTSDRSVLSFLVKPFRDQIAKAFRER